MNLALPTDFWKEEPDASPAGKLWGSLWDKLNEPQSDLSRNRTFNLEDIPKDQLRDVWPDATTYEADLEWVKNAVAFNTHGLLPPTRHIIPLEEYYKLQPWLEKAIADMEDYGNTVFLIWGGPGIGKSCALLYLLIQKLLRGEMVAFCRGSKLHLFTANGVYAHACTDGMEDNFWIQQEAHNHLPHYVPKGTWVLTDAELDPTPPPAFLVRTSPAYWRIIYAASPQEQRLAWLNGKEKFHVRFVMEPPTWKEIFTASVSSLSHSQDSSIFLLARNIAQSHEIIP